MIRRRPPLVRPVLVAGILLGLVAALALPATAGPIRVDRAGRPTQSVSDGVRTLSVSQDVLDPNGQTITVSGSGYDDFKGIYVAFCVEPLPGQIPTPCGGGADIEGNTGASFWISSNPPAYGQGLAIPYGAGGSFSQTIQVSPVIGNIDCRRVQCVVATRNDHIRTSDRSQDLFVPITFAQPVDPNVPDPGNPDQPVETIPETTTTTAPQPLPDEDRPAPAGTVAEDGRTVTAGDLRLAATKTADLDPEGEKVVVTGSGFDETRGVRVAYCAVPDGAAPGPCLPNAKAKAIADDARGWLDVSSNPSPEQAANSTPYGPAGSFGTTIAVVAEIDENTDCREVTCAIVTLAHPDRPRDRGQDLVLPVTFPVEEEPEETTTTTAAVTTTTAPKAEPVDDEGEDDGGSSAPLVAGILVAVAAAAGGTVWWLRRRNGAAPTDGEVAP